MAEVTMPRLSDTMEEGELAKWLKNVGDRVEKGDVLAEIETDKATMDLEAFEAGVLEKQLVEAGTVVPIGQAVAVIGDGSGASGEPAQPADEGEADAGAGGEDEGAGEDEPVAPSDPAGQTETHEPTSPEDLAPSAEPGEPVEAEEPAPEPAADGTGGDAAPRDTRPERPADARIRTSPLARKLAKENGIDLADLDGSGPQGRITRADVEAAIGAARGGKSATRAAGATRPSRPAAAAEPSPEDERVEVSRIRRVAAKRLTESQAVPHFFLTTVVDVEKLLAFRADVNRALSDDGIKASVTDLLVRAAAVALRRNPDANSSWDDGALLRHGRVNVGVAVATDDGLLVPVVHDADRLGIGDIATETVRLADAARAGKLKLDEMSGGTFSISNLGMFGIDEFTAVINPPEAAILAVGTAGPVPVLRDGQLVEVRKLKLTLTVDHRVMDGAVAAVFLRELSDILENPVRMVL